MDEVLDYRRQNYSIHRNYSLSVRSFARELSLMPEEERRAKFDQRQEELKSAAEAIRRASWDAWKKPLAFGLTLAGAGLAFYHSGEPIAAAIAGAAAALGFQPAKEADTGIYSYLFSARRSLQ